MERHEIVRRLRRDMTDAECRRSLLLRRSELGVRFRRQEPIGPYVVDFVCIKLRLIVEVDGGQHAERTAEDAERTAELERRGRRVIRFWSNDVLMNTDAVIEAIQAAVAEQEIG